MKTTSRITGIGAYIPERQITNDDVLGYLRDSSEAYLSDEELEKVMSKAKYMLTRSGSDIRYYCDERQYCTDIARVASERALEDAGINPMDLDLIIFTGMSKAFIEPATAHVLRNELGAFNANVIDTQDACTSIMKSAEIANSLIKTGAYKNILIAAGERSFDWADFRCKTVDELAWKFGALTIGDGAGALVLQETSDEKYVEDPHHMDFAYQLTKGTYSICSIGLNYRIGDRYKLYSHSSKLIRAGLTAILEMLPKKLSEEKYQDFQYDNLFIHDIGKVIDDMVLPAIKAAEIHVPDNYRSFFGKFGNVGSVSLPLQLWMAKNDGRLAEGNKAVYICPAAGVQAGMMAFVA